MYYSTKTVLFLVLIHICNIHAAEPEKKIKSQRELVGAELTPTNALFPRPVYGKNDTDEEVERATTTRSLFVILDESEDLVGTLHAPMSSSLLIMLYQKAGPILVSGSLLHNIFGRISGEKIKACKALEKTLIQKMKSMKKQRVQFLENLDIFKAAHLQFEDLIHCNMINSFNPEEWIIKSLCQLKNGATHFFY